MEGEMLKGHLDMIVLAALANGPAHGYAIIQEIQRRSAGTFELPEGTVYPVLHRLEAQGWVAAKWELSDKGKRARYYRLTPSGRKQLISEQSKWAAFARAVSLILKPAGEEGQ